MGLERFGAKKAFQSREYGIADINLIVCLSLARAMQYVFHSCFPTTIAGAKRNFTACFLGFHRE